MASSSSTTVTPEEEQENVPLSERMRTQTKNVHDQSDRLFKFKIAMVLTSKELYAEAISLFWPIYDELESLLERHKDHPQLRLYFPLLKATRRAPKFEQDMAALLGSQTLALQLQQRRCRKDEHGKPVYSPPELQAYIDHLHLLSDKNPIILLAYVHAMYGAIFAGGAIIKRMVKRAFSLKTNEGVTMFELDFDDSSGFENAKAVSNELKRILNEEIQLSKEDEQLLLEESPQVFVRNNALVATVEDSSVFATATQKCMRFLGLVIAVPMGIAIVAIYLARRNDKT
jgi:heme oxygenase